MVVLGYVVELMLGVILVAIAAWIVLPQQVEELVEALRDRTPGRLAEYRELRVLQRRRLAQLRHAPEWLPRNEGVVHRLELVAERPFDQEAA